MPYIKKEFTDSLLDKVDIVDIISDYTELKRKGASFFGLSPFQKEKSPSFNVSKQKQRFTCYSSGKSGNAVTFLMEHNKMTFPEAIEEIAKKYGIPVEYADEKQASAYAKTTEKKQKARPILDAALVHYQKALLKVPTDHPAKKEVIGKRQYTKDIIVDWQLGYATGGRFLTEKLKEANLLKQAQEISLVGDKADKYWERIIYPIHDIKGLLVGFAGRDISNKDSSAKWINPAESIIYHKDKIWFALDRALRSIIETGEANIVEGYNDVIAWHENGLQNTIASCGTAITETQIQILGKYCKRINFTFDDDTAGKKAMLRYIPLFLAAGFRVNVQTTAKLDPDDFVREYKTALEEHQTIFSGIKALEQDDDFMMNALKFVNDGDVIREITDSKLSAEKYALQKVLIENGVKTDGFKFLLQEHLTGNDIDRSKGAYKLCEIIAKIEDEALKEIYIPWLKTESKVSVATLKKWVKQAEAKFEAQAEEKERSNRYLSYDGASADDDYTLPDGIKKTWKEVKNDVYKYGLFESDNKMWIRKGTDAPYTFKAITNCYVEIVQHMSDEEFPMKLLRIRNVYGLEKIFDTPSESVDSQQRFTTVLSNNGNFMYTGDSREFLKLKVYLNDKMGVGRKVEVLGHQPEGFWVWNNLVQLYDGTTIDIDDNGVFKHDKVSYYVPSANKIYRKNVFKYDGQKRFRVQQAKVTFKTFGSKAMEVHREHAISGIMFAISSLFQDVVVKALGNFPILFLYGPGGSGKDQLAEMIQSFVGIPQESQNIEGGASTLKAKVIELSQFFNGISQYSEYKRGDDKVDGIFKGIWDRNGYKRGNITSKIALETVPILSSAILTGNDYPNQEPLIQRLFANEITKNEFSEAEGKSYDEFKDMCSDGYSSYSVEFLKHRKLFIEQFKQKFRAFRKSFIERVPDAKTRMISNASVFGATYEIFKDKVDFPFSFKEMETHFIKCIEQQMRKLQSESIINKWWDCFLAGCKAPSHLRLVIKEDFKLEGRSLFFNYTNVYLKMQKIWWEQYKEAIPGKSFMKDQLNQSEAFVAYHSKGIKMDSGRDVKTSSGHEIDLEKTGIFDEIYDAIQYQLSAQGGQFVFPPATPLEKINPEDDEPEDLDELLKTFH
ncbi:DNA primase [Algibacter miyuki]|uniref:DNA primase n=1 Tax=Algibacter miyuki TaxID=1306933 RepID=A0ABV5H483_9FLAO|nr:DNA primase [Algibacter miyuki]MDN3665593.1 DNA primase [Algibacter miyuki]